MHKVAFVAVGYIKDYDGVSVYIENLLRRFLEQPEVASGQISVDIYVSQGVMDLLCERVGFDGGAEHIRFIAVDDRSSVKKALHLQKILLSKHDYDVVFTANPMPLFFSSGRRVKVIHDLTIKQTPELFSGIKHKYIDLLINYMKYFDDAIGYISEQTKHDMERFYGISAAKKKLLYVPNGIPFKVLDTPRPPLEDALQKYGTDSIDFVVVGRINRSKGFDRILTFLRYLDGELDKEKRFEKVTLHIAGKQTDETKALFEDASLQHITLKFYGYVSDEALNELYAKSHFCFFLSRNEGYGLPLVEAMWMRTVPVISDIEVFREIMTDAYPKFSDTTGYENAILEFITSVMQNEAFRKEIFIQLDKIVAHEKEGYLRSARNLIAYIQEGTAS